MRSATNDWGVSQVPIEVFKLIARAIAAKVAEIGGTGEIEMAGRG
jgi:hypothetical protein